MTFKPNMNENTEILNVYGRILLQDVPAGIRPTITLPNRPSGMPTTNSRQICSSIARTGATNQITDPFYLTTNASEINIIQFNFSGTIVAGWLEIVFG